MCQILTRMELLTDRFRTINVPRFVKPYEYMVTFHTGQGLDKALEKRRAPTNGRRGNIGNDSNPQSSFSFTNRRKGRPGDAGPGWREFSPAN
jgi:hypothetical protein